MARSRPKSWPPSPPKSSKSAMPAPMAGMTEAERMRFRAAKEFRLAKRCFRVLCAMTRRCTIRRPDAAWFALRDRARVDAEAHLEAWRLLRWRERKMVAA
jgi:hypothetical protein